MIETLENPVSATQPYHVLARKYRPHDFEDLIGQEPMVQTLSNAFRTGRIAQAYMLTGVRGVGKTTTARILARALNYAREGVDQPSIDLSVEGEHCKAIIEGRHMDVIEMDAASHTGVDAMRDLIESAQYRPTISRYKVYIVDEVHMLSGSAFNALLKTLEEPPEHVKFIFATTEIRKVPVTVLSRCQRFDLRRIEADRLGSHLADVCEQEGVNAEAEALAMIARAADGSVRDSLSMLDQAIAHGSQNKSGLISAGDMRSMLGLSDRARIVDLFEYIMKGEVANALQELKSQYETGAEPQIVLTDLADFIHLVTRLKYVPDSAKDNSLSETERTRGCEFSEKLSVRVLGRAWQMLLKGLTEVSAANRPLPAAEMVLVRMAHAASLPTPDEVIRDMKTGKGEARTPPLKHDHGTGPAKGGANDSDTVNTSSLPTAKRQSSTDLSPPTVMENTIASGNVVMLRSPNIDPVPQNDDELPDAPPKIALHSFEELIFLVEDKRDLPLKAQIKKHISVVSFKDGCMEMNLVADPPHDFLTVLAKRLEGWTGKRWSLVIKNERGAKTLAEVESEENASRMNDAQNDPTVQAVLKNFPDSVITSIRVRGEVPSTLAKEHKDVDGDGDGDELGGFFQP